MWIFLIFLFVSSYCIRPLRDHGIYTRNFFRLLALASWWGLSALLLRLEPTQAKTKEKKEKQDKTKDTLPLILLTKKRVAVALDASSPFLRAGVPSAWCSQRPRQ
jgi:hypothetical protein